MMKARVRDWGFQQFLAFNNQYVLPVCSMHYELLQYVTRISIHDKKRN